MNIVTYFLLFVVILAILVIASIKIWNAKLSENKGLNVFIIIFMVTTVFTLFGVELTRRLQRKTKDIMPSVGKKGNTGLRGSKGTPAQSCKCNDDTNYKKVMAHITLVYNEWNRINGFPSLPTNKYIKNKFIKNKVNMICNSSMFNNLLKQNGANKFPYTNFKKGVMNGEINTCDIKSNCGGFDLLLEVWRKWILTILKYDKGKYFLDSEDLTDRDFDTLITELDKDQSALPGFGDDNINWIFENPIIFPNPGKNYIYDKLRTTYVITETDGSKTFNDALYEKDNISLYEISDNVKFKNIDAAKKTEFYQSKFYKFYSVNGVVSVDGENTMSPFDEIKQYDAWYWGASKDTKPKLVESCDSVYDDPQRKYDNIEWDIVDSDTAKSIKPLEGSLVSEERDQWGSYKFDNFSKKINSVSVIQGKEYKLVSDNKIKKDERWYGSELEIKDGSNSTLIKLGYNHTDPLIFSSDKIRIRIKPDFEFYDEDTPKIKLKISNDYDHIWDNVNKRQVKANSPETISGTSRCKFKKVYIPYRNKGNVINEDGVQGTHNKKIDVYRAKDFSDKGEKELKYKYYKPLGDTLVEDRFDNKKGTSNECRPYIEANKKTPADFKTNGPKQPTLLVSGDVVKPKEYQRTFIRKRYEGVHQNDLSYSFWKPIPPDDNYVCLGDVVSGSLTGKAPSLDAVRCLPKQCVEEISEADLNNIVKPIWTTKDYNNLTLNQLQKTDAKLYNAIKGDGWRCGVQPSLDKFVGDTDYYYNVDNIKSDTESPGNYRDIDIFTNKNTPSLNEIKKNYDFSVDSENLLEKYNIIKARGVGQSEDERIRFVLKTQSKIITYDNQTGKIFLSINFLEKDDNIRYYNTIFFEPVDDTFRIYFEIKESLDQPESDPKTKVYIFGGENPRVIDDKSLASKYKKVIDGSHIKLVTVIGGVDKELLFSVPIIKGGGVKMILRIEADLNRNNRIITSRVYTEINGIRYYLYENTSNEIKLTTDITQGTRFTIDLLYPINFNQKKIMLTNNHNIVYFHLGQLKTTNVLPQKNTTNSGRSWLSFQGSSNNAFTSLSGGFSLGDIGFEKYNENKFSFEKYTSSSDVVSGTPKFYRIKKQCIYNPKEYKFKKPEITVGEKYGKEYSFLKIYD
jgi:hypothetical protein